MDLRSGEIKSLYFKYLASAFGSALISCIYGVVDMAMVGQYEGPGGTAALAVVAPVWNILYSLGFLTGIGGSVIFNTKKALRAAGMIQMHILRQPLWVLFCLRLLPGAGFSSAGLSSCFAALLRRLFRMACHAADGACNGALRCRVDEKVYRGGINRIPRRRLDKCPAGMLYFFAEQKISKFCGI